MSMERKLSHQEFLNREYEVSHLAYERETAFFYSVKTGNLEEALRLFQPLDHQQLGRLSEDKLYNLKYHLIITIALLTRCCVEGGMAMEAAYNLSDAYIRTLDQLRSEAEIHAFHRRLIEDYTKKMQAIRHSNRYPKAVTLCLDYIYDNLHKKITLDELAGVAGLSPSYLSRLFHREVGLTVSAYIISKRIEAAENMLKHSGCSCLEISNYLCFSSESHFIQTFRKHTGCTPKRYREIFFRVH